MAEITSAASGGFSARQDGLVHEPLTWRLEGCVLAPAHRALARWAELACPHAAVKATPTPSGR